MRIDILQYKLILEKKINESGFESVISWLKDNQTSSYKKLSSDFELNISPIDLRFLIKEILRESNQMEYFKMDSFIRIVNELLPEGIFDIKNQQFDIAHAISIWMASIDEKEQFIGKLIWKKISELTIPPNWKPLSFDNLLLIELFKYSESEKSSLN